jgi:cytidine deaminase
VHAEQAALIIARSQMGVRVPQRMISAVYVASPTGATPPCGHCRQFLVEFALPGCVWFAESTDRKLQRSGLLADLLPEMLDTYL